MKNKKIMSILSTSLAFVIIFIGVFAFFSDNSILNDSAKVGTFDIEAIGGISHSRNLDNINPGDNDPSVPEDYRYGSDHEFSFTLNNLGSKSAITRAVISVYGTGLNGDALTEEELTQIILSERNEQKNTASDTDNDKYTEISNNTILTKTKFEENKLIYIVGNNNNWTLDGTEENEIIAEGTSLAKTFDIGLKQEVGNPDGTTIKYGNLEGATIHIDIQIQAMQYRNTGDELWEIIFEDSTTSTTPENPEELKDPLLDLSNPETVKLISDVKQEITAYNQQATKGRMIGRLYIPDINLDIMLIQPISGYEQEVTDGIGATWLPDSGWGKNQDTIQNLIAEHNYQEFNDLTSCKTGTMAYINDGSKITAYKCLGKGGAKHVVVNGNSIDLQTTSVSPYSTSENSLYPMGKYLSEQNEGGFTAYTCSMYMDQSTGRRQVYYVAFEPFDVSK